MHVSSVLIPPNGHLPPLKKSTVVLFDLFRDADGRHSALNIEVIGMRGVGRQQPFSEQTYGDQQVYGVGMGGMGVGVGGHATHTPAHTLYADHINGSLAPMPVYGSNPAMAMPNHRMLQQNYYMMRGAKKGRDHGQHQHR